MNDTKDILNNQNEVTQGEENSIIHKEEYTIYNYFKERPAFLVAFFSGLVAAISFVFNYCISQYHAAYLKCWSVDNIYAVSNNKTQLQSVLMVFSYLLAIAIIEILISNTAETYEQNKLNSLNYKKARNRSNIILSIFISYLLGLFLITPFMYMSAETIVLLFILMAFLIGLVLFINFTLVFLRIGKAKRNVKSAQPNVVGNESDNDKYLFPIERLATKGFKSILSDAKLKVVFITILMPVIVLMWLYPVGGTNAASNKKDFPIIVDDTGVYAVVYNNGEALVLEQATINDDTIVVDTNKQRIIKSNDISYEVSHFNNVYIRDNDNNG